MDQRIKRRPSMLPDFQAPVGDRARADQQYLAAAAAAAALDQRRLQQALHHQNEAAAQAQAVAAAAAAVRRPRLNPAPPAPSAPPGMPIQRPNLQPLQLADTHRAAGSSAMPSSRQAAYQPEVEAISPTGPGDECPTASSPKTQELLKILCQVDHEIATTETQISNLEKKERKLREATLKPSDERFSSPEHEQRQMSLAQRIYIENKKRAEASHAMLDKPGLKIAAPLYNQPSDTAIYHENRRKFIEFKPKLVAFLKKRRQVERMRERYLTDRYDQLMQTWIKKVEKLENGSKKKAKDAKYREVFEKTFPEIRRQREEKERFSRLGSRLSTVSGSGGSSGYARSEAEMEQIIDGLSEREEEERRMRQYAVVPPMMLDPWQRKRFFINTNGLVDDPLKEHQERQRLHSLWSQQEKDVFKEKYLQHPKNFAAIAHHLERKTVADCVHFYYASKKEVRYKQLVRKTIKRKPKERFRPIVKEEKDEQPPPDDPGAGGDAGWRGGNGASGGAAGGSGTGGGEAGASEPDSGGGAGGRATQGGTVRRGSPPQSRHDASSDEERPSSAPPVDAAGPSGQQCALCGNELEFLVSRPLTRSNCEQYGVKQDSVAPDARVCPNCRCNSVARRRFTTCPVPSCKTPKKKVKRLRPLPTKLTELSRELRAKVYEEIRLSGDVDKCCTACHSRIQRAVHGLEGADGTAHASTGEAGPSTTESLHCTPNKEWSAAEIEQFKKALSEVGRNWPKVSKVLRERNESDCKSFYGAFKRKLALDRIVEAYKSRKISGSRGDKRVSQCESITSTLTAPSDEEQERAGVGDSSNEEDTSDTDSVGSLPATDTAAEQKAACQRAGAAVTPQLPSQPSISSAAEPQQPLRKNSGMDSGSSHVPQSLAPPKVVKVEPAWHPPTPQKPSHPSKQEGGLGPPHLPPAVPPEKLGADPPLPQRSPQPPSGPPAEAHSHGAAPAQKSPGAPLLQQAGPPHLQASQPPHLNPCHPPHLQPAKNSPLPQQFPQGQGQRRATMPHAHQTPQPAAQAPAQAARSHSMQLPHSIPRDAARDPATHARSQSHGSVSHSQTMISPQSQPQTQHYRPGSLLQHFRQANPHALLPSERREGDAGQRLEAAHTAPNPDDLVTGGTMSQMINHQIHQHMQRLHSPGRGAPADPPHAPHRAPASSRTPEPRVRAVPASGGQSTRACVGDLIHLTIEKQIEPSPMSGSSSQGGTSRAHSLHPADAEVSSRSGHTAGRQPAAGVDGQAGSGAQPLQQQAWGGGRRAALPVAGRLPLLAGVESHAQRQIELLYREEERQEAEARRAELAVSSRSTAYQRVAEEGQGHEQRLRPEEYRGLERRSPSAARYSPHNAGRQPGPQTVLSPYGVHAEPAARPKEMFHGPPAGHCPRESGGDKPSPRPKAASTPNSRYEGSISRGTPRADFPSPTAVAASLAGGLQRRDDHLAPAYEDQRLHHGEAGRPSGGVLEQYEQHMRASAGLPSKAPYAKPGLSSNVPLPPGEEAQRTMLLNDYVTAQHLSTAAAAQVRGGATLPVGPVAALNKHPDLEQLIASQMALQQSGLKLNTSPHLEKGGRAVSPLQHEQLAAANKHAAGAVLRGSITRGTSAKTELSPRQQTHEYSESRGREIPPVLQEMRSPLPRDQLDPRHALEEHGREWAQNPPRRDYARAPQEHERSLRDPRSAYDARPNTHGRLHEAPSPRFGEMELRRYQGGRPGDTPPPVRRDLPDQRQPPRQSPVHAKQTAMHGQDDSKASHPYPGGVDVRRSPLPPVPSPLPPAPSPSQPSGRDLDRRMLETSASLTSVSGANPAVTRRNDYRTDPIFVKQNYQDCTTQLTTVGKRQDEASFILSSSFPKDTVKRETAAVVGASPRCSEVDGSSPATKTSSPVEPGPSPKSITAANVINRIISHTISQRLDGERKSVSDSGPPSAEDSPQAAYTGTPAKSPSSPKPPLKSARSTPVNAASPGGPPPAGSAGAARLKTAPSPQSQTGQQPAIGKFHKAKRYVATSSSDQDQAALRAMDSCTQHGSATGDGTAAASAASCSMAASVLLGGPLNWTANSCKSEQVSAANQGVTSHATGGSGDQRTITIGQHIQNVIMHDYQKEPSAIPGLSSSAGQLPADRKTDARNDPGVKKVVNPFHSVLLYGLENAIKDHYPHANDLSWDGDNKRGVRPVSLTSVGTKSPGGSGSGLPPPKRSLSDQPPCRGELEGSLSPPKVARTCSVSPSLEFGVPPGVGPEQGAQSKGDVSSLPEAEMSEASVANKALQLRMTDQQRKEEQQSKICVSHFRERIANLLQDQESQESKSLKFPGSQEGDTSTSLPTAVVPDSQSSQLSGNSISQYSQPLYPLPKSGGAEASEETAAPRTSPGVAGVQHKKFDYFKRHSSSNSPPSPAAAQAACTQHAPTASPSLRPSSESVGPALQHQFSVEEPPLCIDEPPGSAQAEENKTSQQPTRSQSNVRSEYDFKSDDD